MPRRNRPKGAPKRTDDERPGLPDLVVGGPPGWQVRAIQPANATKDYVCPGCNQAIRPRTAHVVAWRTGEEDLRRHWHQPCWQREARALGGARD
jgi:hypothetical protein